MTRIEIIQHNILKLSDTVPYSMLSRIGIYLRCARRCLDVAKFEQNPIARNKLIRAALSDFWIARGIARTNNIDC